MKDQTQTLLLLVSLFSLLLTSGIRAYVELHFRKAVLEFPRDDVYYQAGNEYLSVVPRPIRHVAMEFTNGSSIYPIDDDRKWASFVPPHHGFVRLGSVGQPSSVAMAHQLHCVNGIRFAYVVGRDHYLSDPEEIKENFDHTNHCFDLIRLSILCNADSVPVPAAEDGGLGRLYGTTHSCRDWTQIVDYTNENQMIWKDIPLPPPSESAAGNGSEW